MLSIGTRTCFRCRKKARHPNKVSKKNTSHTLSYLCITLYTENSAIEERGLVGQSIAAFPFRPSLLRLVGCVPIKKGNKNSCVGFVQHLRRSDKHEIHICMHKL